ncbi:hypothetical protein M3Y99_00238600 [Aphelenchoides fujianensis]|nr:hypothetical protein M3Y99_00238600 [Aphelenchoides fujianensis]
MEAAVVKPRPRIRAVVRDGLNRFMLIDAWETDEKESIRLAVSRVHLASVGRSVRGIKFSLYYPLGWLVKIKPGLGAPKIDFSVDQTEMIAVIKLLAVPVHLKFANYWEEYKDVDWEQLQQIEQHVNRLTVIDDPRLLKFSAFVNGVAPHLLDEFNALHRHKIHRLDVSLRDLSSYTVQSNQVISLSIKALGIVIPHVYDQSTFSSDSIESFRRRFPALEDLHIVCYNNGRVQDLSAYFTKLWAKCLGIRDRLHVAGLKRLFVTVKHECFFHGTENTWFERLKQVEPFDKATSTIDRSCNCVRMFLKHNEPRGPKPTFVLIKGIFWPDVEEDKETAEVSR